MAIENPKCSIGFTAPMYQSGAYIAGPDKCNSNLVVCFDWKSTDGTQQGYYVLGSITADLAQPVFKPHDACIELGLATEQELHTPCEEAFGKYMGPRFNKEGKYLGSGSHTNNSGPSGIAGAYEFGFTYTADGSGVLYANIAGLNVTDVALETAIAKHTMDQPDPQGQTTYELCASVLIVPSVVAAVVVPRARTLWHKIRSKFGSK